MASTQTNVRDRSRPMTAEEKKVILASSAGTITLTATGDFAAGLQVYAPAAQPIICVEPVSHMPDAPNRPVLAAAAPMRVLAQGQSLHGTIRLSAT